MKLFRGYYSANYFLKAKKVLKKSKNTCEMQFTHFTKEPVMVSGIFESIKIIKKMIPLYFFKKIEVFGKEDGDVVSSSTPVLIIRGKYKHFSHVENIIDGILARRSSITNNCHKLLEIVPSEKVIFMADRTDDYRMQPFDGYSAHVAGIKNFVTSASISLIKNKTNVSVIGTMPHALIQQYDGDLSKTIFSYEKTFGSKRTTALIDYHNDIVSEINEIAPNFPNLWAIRIDTSGSVADQSFSSPSQDNFGVSHALVTKARETLNKNNLSKTKIIISSNLNIEKISDFELQKSPVDFYGIGSSLLERNIHFTADLVTLNGKHQAKYGRKALFSPQDFKKFKRYI